LEAALAEPFPAEFVQRKTKGGSSVSFVGWHIYVMRLNDLVGPGWSMGEPILKEVGGKLIMGLPVTIFGITRVNFGSEDEEHGNADDDGKVRDFGSAETNSFAQALKRTLALFGMGLNLYDKTGAYSRYREQEAHRSALDYIRETAARCADDVMLALDGESRPLKPATKKAWSTLKRDPAAALTFARAVADSTGEELQPLNRA
jgi:hypothetical protein